MKQWELPSLPKSGLLTVACNFIWVCHLGLSGDCTEMVTPEETACCISCSLWVRSAAVILVSAIL